MIYFAICIIILTAFFIFKRYQTHSVLILSGLLMIILGTIFTGNSVADIISSKYNFKPTGSGFFDFFESLNAIMSQRTATIGMVAMTAAGFSTYMSKIGAANTLVRLTINPLTKLNQPYLILAFSYLVGQSLNLVISSPAGLAMLLLISVYPILTKAGVSPLTAAAVIGTTGALDLGPGSGNANVAAETLGLPIAEYFATKQLLIAIPVAILVAITHYFVQRFFDKREGFIPESITEGSTVQEHSQHDEKNTPGFYALLPFLPIILLLTFSSIGIKGIKLNTPTAMFVTWFFILFIDMITLRNVKEALENGMEFFKGMGKAFSSIVVLIVAAQMFTFGLEAMGVINLLKSAILGGNLHYIIVTIFAMIIIALTATLTGSGNAAFFSFANLGPELALASGIKDILLVLPMQFAAGFGRSLSPVAAVIIGVSAVAKVEPFQVIKRTMIPMFVGLLSTLILSQIIF